jgi:MFS family permease
VREEIREGLETVWRQPILRATTGCTATFNFFASLSSAVSALYLLRVLQLSPVEYGLLAAASGPGAALGAMIAAPVARRHGVPLTLVAGLVLSASGALVVPLASGPPQLVSAALAMSGLLGGLWGPIWSVNVISLRQQLVPVALQARVTATIRTVVCGAMLCGSLAGGFLGEVVGLRPTLVLGSLGVLLAILWVLMTELRRVNVASVPQVSHPHEPGSAEDTHP